MINYNLNYHHLKEHLKVPEIINCDDTNTDFSDLTLSIPSFISIPSGGDLISNLTLTRNSND